MCAQVKSRAETGAEGITREASETSQRLWPQRMLPCSGWEVSCLVLHMGAAGMQAPT